jgi:hypothetical protein
MLLHDIFLKKSNKMKKTFVLLAGIAFAAVGIAAGLARPRPSARQQAQAQSLTRQQAQSPSSARQQAEPSTRQQAAPQSPQPQSAQYLIVSFYEDYDIGGKSKMVETHEDGSHQITALKWKNPDTFNRKVAHDDSVMVRLKSFFDQGWSLVSINNGTLGASYYLRKGQ